MPPPPVLWSPPADALSTTRVGAYLRWLERDRGMAFAEYDALLAWSVDDPAAFWRSIWDHFEIAPGTDPGPTLPVATMPGARWFPDARLSWTEVCLRLPGRRDDDPVVIGRSQTRERITLTAAELREAVARVRAGLRSLGVGPGDRVAAYLPNIPEAIVACLATASLGAAWSSCPPEFGVRSVIDRWSQIEPVVLLTVDGYRYASKAVDRAAEVAEIRAALPSLRATVLVPYLGSSTTTIADAQPWADLLAATRDSTSTRRNGSSPGTFPTATSGIRSRRASDSSTRSRRHSGPMTHSCRPRTSLRRAAWRSCWWCSGGGGTRSTWGRAPRRCFSCLAIRICSG